MVDTVTVTQIEVPSPQYHAALGLRNKLLRRPLGLDLMKEPLEREADDLHFCACHEDALVGTLVLTPLGNSQMKMRQVAVDIYTQGQGVGRKMVAYSEQIARAQGCRAITLHARMTAVSFYQSCGYHTVGEEFLELSIPHICMEKHL